MFKCVIFTLCLPLIMANPLDSLTFESTPILPRFPLTRPLLRPRYDPSRRIVGGQIVNITETPWQISLQDRYFHICGGSIIAQNFVLTAAHCTDRNTAKNLMIRAGSDLYKSGGIMVQVAEIHQNPLFNRQTVDYDYSILKLAESLTYSSQISPIGLPAQDEDVEDDTICFVSGWGTTQSSSESRDKLRGALVPKTNQKRCDKAYGIFGGITDRMICAGFQKGQVDACQG